MRQSHIARKTTETDISLSINLDGSGKAEISTGIGFFDHMLNLFAKHGRFDLEVKAAGDLHVDCHHTVEDVGIVLGKAIKEALGDKKSIKRYGTSYVPMDETLARVVIDLGGRPYLVFDAAFTSQRIGEMDTQMVEEFFRAVAFNSDMNLHINVLYGSNSHHMAEASYKAFARALHEACEIDKGIDGVLSTKGIL